MLPARRSSETEASEASSIVTIDHHCFESFMNHTETRNIRSLKKIGSPRHHLLHVPVAKLCNTSKKKKIQNK